jgi:carbamoyl-phosphate synthase small subunit
LLGLAAGAQTLKMKFGHHGANHPVIDLDSGRVMITSQNHGFAIDEATLPANVRDASLAVRRQQCRASR